MTKCSPSRNAAIAPNVQNQETTTNHQLSVLPQTRLHPIFVLWLISLITFETIDAKACVSLATFNQLLR
jgi:hypothetical protein